MKFKMKVLLEKTTHVIPDKLYIKIRWRMRMGYWLNLKNPVSFNEKIQWLKTNNYWNELREHYIYKKNINTEKNIHSRTLFAIAVQEMCQKYGYKI